MATFIAYNYGVATGFVVLFLIALIVIRAVGWRRGKPLPPNIAVLDGKSIEKWMWAQVVLGRLVTFFVVVGIAWAVIDPEGFAWGRTHHTIKSDNSPEKR